MSDTPNDPAVMAFEALRAEIAAVRATLAAWPERFEERDYAPTLAAIAKSLERMEAHPALKATPEDYERRRSRALDDAAQAYRSDLNVIRAELQGSAAELRRLVGQVRTKERQRILLIAAGIIGLILGVMACNVHFGPGEHRDLRPSPAASNGNV